MKTLIALCLVLCPSFVAAENRGDDRFSIELGVFLEAFETTVRLDSETLGKGTEIDVENDLGLSTDQNNFRFDGTFRITRKQRLEFGYTSWNRDGDRVIDTEIHFGDEIYPVNTTIRSMNATDVYKLAYKYSFLNGERFETGLSFGVSVFDIATSLSAEAVGGGTQFESVTTVGAVPLLGGFFDWKIGDNLVLQTTGELFDLSTGGLDGHMSDLRGALNWYPFRNVGFGAGFNRVGLRYLEDGPGEFQIKYVYSGIMGYAIFSF
jgi:hypothetical protein